MDVRTALYNITPLLRTIVPDGQIRAAFGYRLWNFWTTFGACSKFCAGSQELWLACSLSTLLDILAVSTVCDYLIFPPPHIPVPHPLQGELALVAPVFPHLCHCLSRGRVCRHEKQGVVDLRIVEDLVGSLEGLSSPGF